MFNHHVHAALARERAGHLQAKAQDARRGTMEYEVALEAVDDYSLDWWFRCVDDSSVLAWP
jgi:hypothetical protein